MENFNSQLPIPFHLSFMPFLEDSLYEGSCFQLENYQKFDSGNCGIWSRKSISNYERFKIQYFILNSLNV